MGTRGAYGYRIDDFDKVTYNHWDSYPNYLGRNIMQYISETSTENMKDVARNIVLVGRNAVPSPQLIQKYSKYSDLSVSERRYEDWYCLLRNTQGDLAPYHDDLKHM